MIADRIGHRRQREVIRKENELCAQVTKRQQDQ